MANVQLRTAIAKEELFRPGWTRALAGFALLAAALAALFQSAVLSMASIWLNSSVYHHGIAVAPISAWLIVRRRSWRENSPSADPAGLIFIFAASAIWLIGRAASVDLFGHAAFVIALIGAVVTIFGRALAAQWSFALSFLFFMVPFGEEATPALQHWASLAVAGALNLTGIETAREGFMLATSAGRFEMAASCAGLRYLIASAMVSSIVASLAFRDWRKRGAFIAAAIAAAIIANWLRAYLIVALATATERRIGVGPEHVMLGWAFYSILIIALILVARRMADVAATANAPAMHGAGNGEAPARLTLGALAIAFVFVFYDRAVVSAEISPPTPSALPPLRADGFHPTEEAVEWKAEVDGADLIATTQYRSAAGAVAVTAAYFTHDRAGAEIAGANAGAGDNQAWRRIAVRTERLFVDGDYRSVTIETLEDVPGRKIDVATLYWLGDRIYSSPALLKLDVAAAKLVGREVEGGAFFVAADRTEDANPMAAIGSFVANAQSIEEWRAALPAPR